ncbi:Sperm-associated antigen 17, partial [Geodia barretti]
MTKEDLNNSSSKIEESEEKENQEAGTGTEGGDQLPTARVVAGIPQPPLGVKFSSITAQFRDSLRVSLSQFGPAGNGELPFQPVKPEILLETVTTDGASSSSESRPQSQQTLQKMGKKQMEQLLEQQRQLEEQKKRERAEAQADFDARCSALQRQNKYQQLFASTPYGLHVRLQVDVDLEADPETTDGSDGRIVVSQSYPAQGPRRNIPSLSLATRDEVERYCLPDGSVLCFLRDGSVSVLCPDGHVYHTATQSLSNLYQQNDSSGATDSHKEEDQRNEENSTQHTYSDTKVTFADHLMDRVGSKERKKLSQMVWVVTTPSGQRYLWRCPTPAKPTHQTQDKGESEAAPALGEADTDPDGASNTITQQQQQEKQGGKIVPLPEAQLVSATDPVTKQVLITREDNVTLLEYPDGSFVAEHADGTRITTATAQESDSTLPYEILIECPGFARVTHTATKQSLVEFPDGSTVVGSTNGKYTVGNKAQYKLEVEPGGEARCCLQPADSTAYSFTLDHTGTGNILIAKAKKSKVKFSVDRDGVPSVSGSGAISLHPAFSPRYFVVPSTGSPYQVLSKSEADSYLSEMESQPDTTIIKGEAVPGFEGTTIAVMTNLKEENPAIMPYKNGSIVPENLSLAFPPVNGQKRATKDRKRFGVGVGKSLHILPITHAKEVEVKETEAPKALRCRQFVILDQFNETSRDQVCKDLASYISWREQQEAREDDLLPVDPRDPSEIRAAQQLKSRWLNKTTGNVLSSALLHVQQSSDPTSDGRQKEQGENSTKFLNGIRCDLEEAERNRIALRNHTVPQYFDSDSGREFLRSQSPDMTALAKQLAQPRVRQAHHPPNDPSHSSTPSSLQSTSIILQPDGGVDSPLLQQGEVESPDMGDIDTASVSSTSKLRPTHPTPDHARGLCTPTDVRPSNPTPFGADRQTHSPAPSLISNTPGATPQKMVGGVVVDEQQGERSVSFILPPRRPSLIVGENSPDHPELQRGSKPHNTVEDATRRKVRTCSTMGVGSGVVRGLEATPQSLDFGTIQEGRSYARSLVLKNVGIDPCRFRIKQPPPSTGIRVIYTPGPVSPV